MPPLFQLGFQLVDDPAAAMTMEGLDITPLALPSGTARLDLDLAMTERLDARGAHAGIDGTLTYPTQLYDRSTIRTAGAVVERVLTAVATDPDAPLSTLDAVGRAVLGGTR